MMTALRVLACGAMASVAAALALAAASKTEGRSGAAPLNATSHWLHGDSAADVDEFDVAHTGLGYMTHHSAAILWGGLFQALRQRSSRSDLPAIGQDAVIASATAAIVDYVFTPHRLTPGWELVLSKRSMALAYVAMAAAFMTTELMLPKRDQHDASAAAEPGQEQDFRFRWLRSGAAAKP
jgi:hypothetical protein